MAIDRNYILNKMRGQIMTPDEFNFEALQAPPLFSLLTPTDVGDLHQLATSIRYSGNPLLRMDRINQIMNRRGFKKFAGGTNRMIYKFLEDDSFLIKVASCAVGVGDSPKEFIIQHRYKPFVTKVFETSPCGTVGLFERGLPITSREEFLSVASDVYDVIRNWFTGEYVMDDIGSEFFMNWVIRKGFGPILCDFPYSYKLDGNKLYCNIPLNNDPTHVCGGIIDYDEGFNHLRCTKCGAEYKAKELESMVRNETVIIKGGHSKMKVSFGRGDVTQTVDGSKFMDTAPKMVSRKKKAPAKVGSQLQVSASKGNSKKKTNNDPKPDTTKTIIEKTDAKDGDVTVDGILSFSAEVSNTKDLSGDSKNQTKCLVLTDGAGHPAVMGNKYIIITNLFGKAIDEIAFEPMDAHRALTDSLDQQIEEISALRAENESLTIQLNEKTELLNQLQEEYDALTADDSDPDCPYYIDQKGRKRDKVTNQFWSDKNEGEEEPIQQFDVTSPLMREDNIPNDDEEDYGDEDEEETTEQIKNDIQDKDLVGKIDALLPDDEETSSTEVPVGAAPPKNTGKKSAGKSKRYDPDFYTQPQKGKKNGKK